jgi:catechol 2,3-dioxygenase-like lactoylglutathione lyase family enzyme
VVKLDHLAVFVSDVQAVREWYTSVLGLTVEFESSDPQAIGLKDTADFTLIFTKADGEPSRCNLFFQVDDVESTHEDLRSRGIEFLCAPQNNSWGYGAELHDPDGRLVGLWDERSMRAHAGG